MFQLTINTQNAAFDQERAFEVARLLRVVADKVASGDERGSIKDSNGNTIGSFEMRP